MRSVSFGVLCGFLANLSQAEKLVHIKAIGLKLHGQTQDSNGEDEMNIGMYGLGCGNTGQCYECTTNYDAASDEQEMCDAFVNVHYSKSDCCVLVETVDLLRQIDNVKAFWPYYDMVKQQKVTANVSRTLTGGCPMKLTKGAPAYLMLQEEDLFINDASTTVKIEPSRVDSWYKMFEEMEKDQEEGGKVSKVVLSFSYGFKELSVQTLLEQQMPGISFLIDTLKDQLCVSVVDLALMAGGPIAKSIGKGVAKAAYKKGATKLAARAEAFMKKADDVAESTAGQVGSEVSSNALNALGDFLDQTEFCVVDFIGEGQNAKYEITYELTYQEENADCVLQDETSTAERNAFCLLPWALLLLPFLH